MLKLLKYLRKSIIALIIVTLLLVLQAYSDLALPAYTSDIVNVGVMQSGIDHPVPTVIRATQLDKITFFMTEPDIEVIKKHYTIIDQNQMSAKKWTEYTNKYPLLTSEPLYLWDGKGEEELTKALPIPMLISLGSERGSQMYDQLLAPLLANLPPEAITEDLDLITLLSALDPEDRAMYVLNVRESVASQMPEMILSQSALSFVKLEYETIGLNVSRTQTNYIIVAGLKMLALALVATIASILVTFFAARIAARMGRDLRSKVFHKVLTFSNKEMDQFSTASLITRSTNDIQQVQMLIVMLIRIVIYSPILAIGGIIKVLNTNSSMTWTLGVGVGAIFLLIGTLMIIALPKFKLMQKLVDRINLVTREILTGLPVIRAFSTEKHEKKRFDFANMDLTKNNLFVNRVMTFMFPALMIVMNFVSILIIWVGADRINTGNMQVGDMIAFIQYTMQIIMSFLMLTMISVILPRAGVAAKRIDEILSVNTNINDPETEVICDTKIKGLVEFQQVSFRYPNADEDVLSGIHFTAKPGETTAIIGSTGSGKSTLINLIPRFYDVTAGSIKIDGVDIRNMKQHTLRDKLGYVPQKGVLFTGTIGSNISFGIPDASEQEIRYAARIAQATDFIEAKPEGYDDPIAEGGTNVSGGQKQRLSIARAIAKKPEIYIFDDSFSALDYKTDATLRKTLKEELSDSTVIIVAQRISTIMHAEQILVLDDGQIVGKGTHKELLKDCEVYRQIASSQLSKEELEYE